MTELELLIFANHNFSPPPDWHLIVIKMPRVDKLPFIGYFKTTRIKN
jgi:hypothetical protein